MKKKRPGEIPMPFEKTFFWKFQTSFLREPRRIRMIGALLVLLAHVGLLLVSIFVSPGDTNKTAKLSLFGVSATGSVFIVWGDWISAPLWGILGSPLLSIGLTLLPVAVGIGPVGGKSVVAGVIGMIALIFILAGCLFFLFQGVEDFRLPIFGPHNYFLWGVVAFAAGTVCRFFLFAAFFPDVTLSYFVQVDELGAFLLVLGAMLMFSGNLQWYTNQVFAVLHRFPSTAALKDFLFAARLYYASCFVELAGCFICTISLFFGGPDTSFLWAVFCGCILSCIGTMLRATSMFPAQEYLVFGCLLLQGAAYGLVGSIVASLVLATSSTVQLQLSSYISGAIFIVSAILLAVRSLVLIKGQSKLTVGNQPCFAETCHIVSGVAVILFGYTGLTPWLTWWAVSSFYSHVYSTIHGCLVEEVSFCLNFKNDEWGPDFSIPSSIKDQPDWLRQDLPVEEIEVAIVGGGPAGLTCANEMGRRGISCVLFDQKTQVVPDSRFFICNGHTMEGMIRLGVADMLLQRGQQTDFGNGNSLSDGMAHPDVQVYANAFTYSRDLFVEQGNEVSSLAASRCMNSVWAYQPCQRVMQSVQEACLLEKARTYASNRIMFSTTVLDVRLIDGRPVVLVQDRDGKLVIFRSRFLLGCDGTQSIVSRKMKVCYDGFTHLSSSRSVYFHSADLLARVRTGMCDGHQYQVVRKGVGVGYFALRNANKGLWTFHLHGLYDGRAPGSIELDEMKGIMAEFIGPGVTFEVITDGRWRWGFVVARTFKKGPVMLVGDAAHAWPPFAGNGGNTAYQDSSNLCWKIDGIIKGWAGDRLLDSYNIERRDMTLRGAMGVTTMTPNPKRLKLAGKILLTPILRVIALAHWYFQASGEHLGNGWSQGGLQMGQRYQFSPVVIGGNDVYSPPDDPLSSFIPKVVPGSRVLHVQFKRVQSLQLLVAEEGYTLIKTSSSAHIQQQVKDIEESFAQLGAPLTSVDCSNDLDDPRPGKRNQYAASLWKEQMLVICRPDLYIAWTMQSEKSAWSKKRADRIARTLCGWEADFSDESQAESMNQWLTWRMIQQMSTMRLVFRNGIFVKNKEKEEDKKALTKGDLIQMDDKHGDLYKRVVGDAQQDSHPPKGKEETWTGQDDICFECILPIQNEEMCWFNGKQLHAQCIPVFRKKAGVMDRACAYCMGYVRPGTNVEYNGSHVHSWCLEKYKEQIQQDELDDQNDVPIFGGI